MPVSIANKECKGGGTPICDSSKCVLDGEKPRLSLKFGWDVPTLFPDEQD